MVGFQIAQVEDLTAEQLLLQLFPQMSPNDGPGSHAGVVTIIDSTSQKPREALVRVSNSQGVLSGRAYSDMPKPWIRIGVNMYDLPGVVSSDYTDLAVRVLRQLLLYEEIEWGIFTLVQEDCPPFLTWKRRDVVLHQYISGSARSEWTGPAHTHLHLAEATIPLLAELGFEYRIERTPLEDSY